MQQIINLPDASKIKIDVVIPVNKIKVTYIDKAGKEVTKTVTIKKED